MGETQTDRSSIYRALHGLVCSGLAGLCAVTGERATISNNDNDNNRSLQASNASVYSNY